MIRAVIIDDEPKAIISLEWELMKSGRPVQIVGKYSNTEEALKKVKTLRPDCVFLDIQMPGLDGFSFLEHFPNRNFEVIFVTAHVGHAIKAIRERAFDYLLKPIDQDDLATLLDRIQENLLKKSIHPTTLISSPEKEKIAINRDDQLIMLDPEEVIYCGSEGSYSNIYTSDGGTLLVSKRLKIVENLFSKFRFYRIHHSFLINLDKVKSYDKPSGKVILIGGISLPVSRLKKVGFTEALK